MTYLKQYLEQILSEETFRTFNTIGTTGAQIEFLRNTSDVERLSRDVRDGVATEELLKGIIKFAMKEFQVGFEFPYEPELAAMALALVRRRTQFANEFFKELGELNISELGRITRFVRKLSNERVQLAETTRTEKELEPALASGQLGQGDAAPSFSSDSNDTANDWSAEPHAA